ncbi:Rri2p KNAG_0A01420 [Huiozyma naganishii CBS 8797]|uniref:PCI domain-containing protein n=1 Tax=Huiozyma naganishii (strain ATCC MYA-139 / BCRC 22969 / CBS 8797 / KCTC 17520 / NBRC 10181 / NCYC 3082 / Yp74L-3) TaxID=1071383 RepID=J7S372_HUIN7|nr:hypothetical protein KNAG_0A01420 [Kazachstania naganishii CBS 8797]CCK67831.1 hypothetical protein KNAG_0A01420 [Kazachstania naganishii CBS 8797]
MISEDEEMQMSDMEFESEGEDKAGAMRVPAAVAADEDTRRQPELVLEMGGLLLNDREWGRARALFHEVLSNTSTDCHVLVQSWFHLLECWAQEIRYQNNINKLELYQDCRNFVQFLVREGGAGLELSKLHAILEDLFPSVDNKFLFDLLPEDTHDTTLRGIVRMQLELCETFEPLEHSISEDIEELLAFKRATARQWWMFLEGDRRIDLSILGKLQRDIIQQATLVDSHGTEYLVAKTNFFLQLFISHYFSTYSTMKDEDDKVAECLNVLVSLSKRSLIVSQDSRLMYLYHLSMAILSLPRDTRDQDLGLVTNYRLQVESCRDHFLKCLQHLDQMGTLRSLHLKPGQFVLAGFILTSIVVTPYDEGKSVNPFDFEQLRILKDEPIMETLRGIYTNFLDLKLPEMYHYIGQLHCVARSLQALTSNVQRLGQTLRLWRRVAPTYSSISIDDLRQQLSYSRALTPSRDDILTILMKSVLRSTRETYFKIDLTNDIVHFGAEHRRPLTDFPKRSFALPGKEDGPLSQEYANDVGVYNDAEPARHARGAPLEQFFQTLHQQRDRQPSRTAPSSSSSNCTSNMATIQLYEILETMP